MPRRQQSIPDEPPPLYEARELPPGWVSELDPNYNRRYYIDTLADPPRSIWVHPFDDPLFQEQHHIGVHAQNDGNESDAGTDESHTSSASASHVNLGRANPPLRSESGGHLTAGPPAASRLSKTDTRNSAASSNGDKGFIDKFKDMTLGTKEERAAKKKRKEERRRAEEARQREIERQYIAARNAQIAERERQMRELYQRYQNQSNGSYRTGQLGGGQQVPLNPRFTYAPPLANSYGGPRYVNRPVNDYQYGGSPYYQRRSGGGMGVPILGALAGGLLLGDLLS